MIKGIEIVYQDKKFKFISEIEYKPQVDLKLNLKTIIPVTIRSVESISGRDKICIHKDPAEGLSLFNHDWKEPWKCKSNNCTNQAESIINVLFFKQLYDIRQAFDPSKLMVSYIRGLAFLYPSNKQEQKLLSEIYDKEYIFMELFYLIYQTSKNTQCLRRILEDCKQNMILNSKCLISNLPTKIPVRHRSCQHFDCYDLFSLVLLQKQRQQLDIAIQFKCYKKDCNVVYDITTFEQINKDFFLDIELFEILNKLPLHQTLFEKDINGQLIPYKIRFDINHQIFIKQHHQDSRAKIEERYQRLFNYLCYQDLNSKFFNNIRYDQTDFITNQIIEYPTKCKQCNGDKYLDISTFIFHLINQINEDLIENSNEAGKEIKATCPICHNTYEDSKKQYFRAIQIQPANFHQNIIINNHLIRATRDVLQTKLDIGGQVYFLDYFQNQLCLSDKESLDKLFKGKQISNSCVYTNKQLFNPLLLIKCPERNHIEFDVFFKLLLNLKENESLKLCKCQVCVQDPNQFKNIESYILFNRFLQSKFGGNQQQNKYNFDDEQFVQTPRIESVQEKIIQQNPQIGSIRYQKSFMVDQEKYEGIRIKKITTQLGSEYREEATQLNFESNIDKVGIQESANKYGIKIKSINITTPQAPQVQKFTLK